MFCVRREESCSSSVLRICSCAFSLPAAICVTCCVTPSSRILCPSVSAAICFSCASVSVVICRVTVSLSVPICLSSVPVSVPICRFSVSVSAASCCFCASAASDCDWRRVLPNRVTAFCTLSPVSRRLSPISRRSACTAASLSFRKLPVSFSSLRSRSTGVTAVTSDACPSVRRRRCRISRTATASSPTRFRMPSISETPMHGSFPSAYCPRPKYRGLREA